MHDAIVSLSGFAAGVARALAIGYDVLCAISGELLP
jgi:hypothetical protein